MLTRQLGLSGRSPYDPVSLFLQDVPDDFLRAILLGVLKTWKDADRKARDEYEDPERHDLLPHLRRAMLERELRAVATRHGVTADPAKNKRRTSSFTRLVSGCVIMTASAVREPGEIVRYADFRLTFAQNRQMCMFADPIPMVPDAPLYALMLHGPGAVEPDENGNMILSTAKPGFVDVVFPAPVPGTKSQVEYVGGRVRLLDRFADSLTEAPIIKTEEVEFVAEPTLRPHRKRKDAGA